MVLLHSHFSLNHRYHKKDPMEVPLFSRDPQNYLCLLFPEQKLDFHIPQN